MLNFAIVKLASLLVLGKRCKHHCTRLLAALQYQPTTGNMVKRWTEGQSHFPRSGGGALV